MAKKQIILIGGGGHCKSCIDVIESLNEYEIVGIVDTPSKYGHTILGYKIIGNDDDLIELKTIYDYALVTVGQIKNANLRTKLFEKAKALGFKLPTIVAKTAYVSNNSIIDEGTIIMHKTFINASVKIGKNNIINTGAMVEHDCVIGDHNHISTNATLNGGVIVGNQCFIGSNSTVKNGVSITDNVTIGLSAMINKSIKTDGVYFGNPARKIK